MPTEGGSPSTATRKILHIYFSECIERKGANENHKAHLGAREDANVASKKELK